MRANQYVITDRDSSSTPYMDKLCNRLPISTTYLLWLMDNYVTEYQRITAKVLEPETPVHSTKKDAYAGTEARIVPHRLSQGKGPNQKGHDTERDSFSRLGHRSAPDPWLVN